MLIRTVVSGEWGVVSEIQRARSADSPLTTHNSPLTRSFAPPNGTHAPGVDAGLDRVHREAAHVLRGHGAARRPGEPFAERHGYVPRARPRPRGLPGPHRKR